MEEEILTKEAEKILTPAAVSLIKGEGYQITSELASLKVTNELNYKRAVELGTANKRVLNQIEAFRKAITQPLNDQIKNINSMFKKISARFTENDEKIRKALLTYQNGRKDTETIQNVNASNGGRATIQERWTFEIVNPDLVPREWCIPDEVKIGRAVRAGLMTELPGVKIFKTKSTAFAA
jgi:hypothetical protein